MNSTQRSSRFITFEGLDFSGKSTQVALFAERLTKTGRENLVLRDPGGTAIGERIRSVLLDKDHLAMSDLTELFLFSASRSQLVSEVVKPALSSESIVVCDRFYDSTTAYQGAGRRLPLDSIVAINRVAAGGLVPAITYFIDIPVAEVGRRMARQKSGADRMEMNGIEFYERVRNGFLELAHQEPRFEVINGLLKIEEIHELVWRRFENEEIR